MFRDNSKALLEKFLQVDRAHFRDKTEIKGDNLYLLWDREQLVGEKVGSPFEIKAWIPRGFPGVGPSYLGLFKGKGKPIQILGSRPINQLAYSGAHELGHLFDCPECITWAYRNPWRDETIAEVVAWLLLEPQLPEITGASQKYLFDLNGNPMGVTKWWDRAIAVADAVQLALDDPTRALDLYNMLEIAGGVR